MKVSETRKHIRAGIMQNLFLTKITMWANTRPSSFAVSNTICPARKNVKLFVGTTGTENILLFCITRATPPLQLICFRVLVLKGSQDHWSVPQTLLRSHEILSLTTYLERLDFLHLLQPKTTHQIGCKSSNKSSFLLLNQTLNRFSKIKRQCYSQFFWGGNYSNFS